MITAEIMDKPRDLDAKILSAADQSPADHTRSTRHQAVRDLLDALPCVLFVDEADLLIPDSLHAIRGLSDITGTPICLAGTKHLEARLLKEPRLRPLATRVATRLELAPLNLADLQGALPQLDSPIVLDIWKASAGEFRTIMLILAALRRLHQENPGRKLTRRAVAMAAAGVLAARPIPRGSEEEDLECLEAAEADLGRRQVRPAEVPQRSRQAARAAG
jgi:DNA transposition AAA+ family ATPase